MTRAPLESDSKDEPVKQRATVPPNTFKCRTLRTSRMVASTSAVPMSRGEPGRMPYSLWKAEAITLSKTLRCNTSPVGEKAAAESGVWYTRIQVYCIYTVMTLYILIGKKITLIGSAIQIESGESTVA